MNEEICVCIPIINKINWDYLKEIPEEVHIKVMLDSSRIPEKNTDRANVDFYSHRNHNYSFIPKGTAACVNFASLKAFEEGFKKIIFTHDDCRPEPGFIEKYDTLLGNRPEIDHVSTERGWFNPLIFLGLKAYQRGYPHLERSSKTILIKKQKSKRIVANMGLWTGIPDLDGVDKLKDYPVNYPKKKGNIVVNSQFPLSDMNFGVVRDVLPLFYHMPMNLEITGDWRLWRFEDVWMGYVAERIVDKLNIDSICLGEPYIEHLKKGNIKKEILGEHYGHLISPYFYDSVDQALKLTNFWNKERKNKADYVEIMQDFSIQFERYFKRSPYLVGKVLSQVSSGIKQWGRYFARKY